MLNWWRVSGSTVREAFPCTHRLTPSVKAEQSASTVCQVFGLTRPWIETSSRAVRSIREVSHSRSYRFIGVNCVNLKNNENPEFRILCLPYIQLCLGSEVWFHSARKNSESTWTRAILASCAARLLALGVHFARSSVSWLFLWKITSTFL